MISDSSKWRSLTPPGQVLGLFEMVIKGLDALRVKFLGNLL